MKKPGHLLRGTLVVAVIGLGVVVACSDQGEGDRCEIDNGDSDCGAGLVCVPASPRNVQQGGAWVAAGYTTGVNDPYNSSDRCCPANRALASHPACVKQTSSGADAAPPADSGPPADASTKTDAATDAAPEASTPISDASTDAPDGD